MTTLLPRNATLFPLNSTNVTDSGWVDICVVGSTRGYIAPIGGDAEREWNPYLLGVLYFLGLCWCFLGVSIIADIFMLAIEKITSIDRIITRKDGTKYRIRTWNDTVANLTLMAMGSSAPEIMVNVVEITGAGFYSGDLGPSTVVGSAAFNLLVINAFCTFAIAAGEVRRVKEIGVYAATSATSILAYVWLVVILVAVTPDVVDFWEAAVTFAGFPLLVVGAYLIETKRCECCSKKTHRVASANKEHLGIIKSIASNAELHGDSDLQSQKAAIAAILKDVRAHQKDGGGAMPMRQALQIAMQEIVKRKATTVHHSHAFHRVAAARKRAGQSSLTGAAVVSSAVLELMSQLDLEALDDDDAAERGQSNSVSELRKLKTEEKKHFHFAARDYSVLESTRKVQVVIVRPKEETSPAVRIVSREGTAKDVEDYKHVDEVLYFPPGEVHATFVVDIVEDNVYEDDEYFFLDLVAVRAGSEEALAAEAKAKGTPEKRADAVDVEQNSVNTAWKGPESRSPASRQHSLSSALRSEPGATVRTNGSLPTPRKLSGDMSDSGDQPFPTPKLALGSPTASPRGSPITRTVGEPVEMELVEFGGKASNHHDKGGEAEGSSGTAAWSGGEAGNGATPPETKTNLTPRSQRRLQESRLKESKQNHTGDSETKPTISPREVEQNGNKKEEKVSPTHSSSQSPKREALVPRRFARVIDSATVHIIDDSTPGVLNFSEAHYSVCESEKKITITVTRQHGGNGTVSVKVKTVDREAVSPEDYEGIDEDEPLVLEFAPGDTFKTFDIAVVDDRAYEKDESFDVVLFDPEGGASLKDTTYEHEEVAANVVIISDEKERKVVDRMAQFFALNYGKIRIGSAKYSQQWVEVIFPGGNRECKASPGVWVLHIFAMPWRLVFAIIPPVDLWNGWATFFLALLGIAGATMLMADLAGLLGCVVGFPPAFTAISLVALGTSIPDLFASMNAARADAYADASIGNVMGSNSVNVFMGLGLPWLIATIYWDFFSEGEALVTWARRYQDIPDPAVRAAIADVVSGNREHGFFIVPANDLGFSVGLFCVVALLCLLTFGLRRKFAGGELGGPTASKCVAGWFMIFLWVLYIGISGLYIFGVISLW